MVDFKVLRLNEVYCKVDCDEALSRELSEKYSFKIDNWRFHPLVKAKKWSGDIFLFNRRNKTLPTGLISDLRDYCKAHRYSYELDEHYEEFEGGEFDLEQFLPTLNLPFSPRDYQISALVAMMNQSKSIILSPTGSGKSLIIYIFLRWLMEELPENQKILIIVPSVGLVYQLFDNFKTDYGWKEAKEYCHLLCEGEEKKSNKKVIISTWQSLQWMATDKKVKNRESTYDPEYFEQFGAFIGDECHKFASDALKNINNACVNAFYKCGLTGSLAESKTNKMALIGEFGRINQFVTTSELIENKTLSEFQIKTVVFNHPDKIKDVFRKTKPKYQDEVDYLVTLEARNKMIAKMAVALKGNTVVTFRYIDKQGKPLFEMIKEMVGPNRNVYYYAGEVNGADREKMREVIEKEKDCIVVSSLGSFSTGVNIVNLSNLIFASPSKSRIQVLQTIGRVLRKGEGVADAVLYDLADDLKSKTYKNTTYQHLIERLKIYVAEKFKYRIIQLDLKY